MECTGHTDSDCCNGVVNNMCVDNCTAPARPLTSANYTCSEWTVLLPWIHHKVGGGEGNGIVENLLAWVGRRGGRDNARGHSFNLLIYFNIN